MTSFQGQQGSMTKITFYFYLFLMATNTSHSAANISYVQSPSFLVFKEKEYTFSQKFSKIGLVVKNLMITFRGKGDQNKWSQECWSSRIKTNNIPPVEDSRFKYNYMYIIVILSIFILHFLFVPVIPCALISLSWFADSVESQNPPIYK